MPYSRDLPTKSYSVNRVNRLFASVFSFLLVAVFAEALVNGFSQREYLDPLWFTASAAVAITLVFGFLVSHFVFGAPLVWFRLIPIFTLVLLATWPVHFDVSSTVPDSFKPWIWWLLGVSAIAAGTSFRFVFGVLYIVLVCVGWIALRVSPYGGSGELALAIQDALHLFVMASIGAAMTIALRWQAAKTDFANQQAIASGVKSASRHAVDLERTRLDALVHDSVLTTLLLASKSQTPEQMDSVRKYAGDAITKLELTNKPLHDKQDFILVSFAEALRSRILDISPDVDVSIERANNLPIPEQIAEALSEATLQAVDNILKHAGRSTKKRVSMQGQGSGIKIVISDNGKGFRPSRIPRDRLGIQLAIIARVKNVGGRVFINSKPGNGTDVVIEWSPDD